MRTRRRFAKVLVLIASGMTFAIGLAGCVDTAVQRALVGLLVE